MRVAGGRRFAVSGVEVGLNFFTAFRRILPAGHRTHNHHANHQQCSEEDHCVHSSKVMPLISVWACESIRLNLISVLKGIASSGFVNHLARKPRAAGSVAGVSTAFQPYKVPSRKMLLTCVKKLQIFSKSIPSQSRQIFQLPYVLVDIVF